MHDWNHNGKIDDVDRMIDYHIFEETNRNTGRNYNHRKSSGKGPWICFILAAIFMPLFFPIGLFFLWAAIVGALVE